MFMVGWRLSSYSQCVQSSHFEEPGFFAAIASAGVRALLIGRRALIALGLPLLTRDYDYWLHCEDIEAFNDAVSRFDLFPNHPPEEALSRGRYVLENDEKVDVLVARSVFTIDKTKVLFDASGRDDERSRSLPGSSRLFLPWTISF